MLLIKFVTQFDRSTNIKIASSKKYFETEQQINIGIKKSANLKVNNSIREKLKTCL